MAKTSPKRDFIYAVGRRKTATARTRLFIKPGPIVVNNKPIDQYFPGLVSQLAYEAPLKAVDMLGKASASFKVEGSGIHAQLAAVIHGLARALVNYKPDDFRTPLRQAGFLTRDARAKERRKVGTGGKARRQKQSPKR